jgi:dTDP-4-dehydrorhamnose 3,5-epimerase
VLIEETLIQGLFVVRPEPATDDRGLFARLWCRETFAAAGVPFEPVQMSASFSRRAGTLRGMHWQDAPHAETKLIRVTAGRVFDVAVDLRLASPTAGRWFGIELTAANRTGLLIPKGFAHGLLTLEDETEVLYAMDVPFAPAAAQGARFDDPAFAIAWPREPAVIAEKDLSWPPVGMRG